MKVAPGVRSASGLRRRLERFGSLRWRLPLAVAGLCILGLYWLGEQRVWAGVNDFLPLYLGARLMGTPDQFNPVRYRQEQIAISGWVSPAWEFIRLPGYALVLRPLGWLPYRPAHLLWEALSLAALVGFVLLWPVRDRGLLAVACCWSFPLSLVFANGQDDTLLLLFLALAMRYADRKPFAAGVAISLCAIKYQLFFPLPLALIAAKRGRMLAGVALGFSCMLAACFAAAGPHWPRDYVALVFSSRTNPAVEIMPNLRGILAHMGHPLAAEICAAILVAATVCMIAARLDFGGALAGAAVGGLLVSHHAYAGDLCLLIPAFFGVRDRSPHPILNLAAIALLLPHWFMVNWSDPPGRTPAVLFVLAMAGMLGYLAICAYRPEQSPQTTTRCRLSRAPII